MKVSIIKDDSFVGIDGFGINGIDLSSIPDSIHAIQWDGSIGEVEYKSQSENGVVIKPANSYISSISDYQPIIDAFNVAKTELENQADNTVVITEKVE